ncbi:MAG: hypothetical protein AB1465_02660 [Patescibacteria group bacterium]
MPQKSFDELVAILFKSRAYSIVTLGLSEDEIRGLRSLSTFPQEEDGVWSNLELLSVHAGRYPILLVQFQKPLTENMSVQRTVDEFLVRKHYRKRLRERYTYFPFYANGVAYKRVREFLLRTLQRRGGDAVILQAPPGDSDGLDRISYGTCRKGDFLCSFFIALVPLPQFRHCPRIRGMKVGF